MQNVRYEVPFSFSANRITEWDYEMKKKLNTNQLNTVTKTSRRNLDIACTDQNERRQILCFLISGNYNLQLKYSRFDWIYRLFLSIFTHI